MNKLKYIALPFLLISIQVKAQTSIDSVLVSVANNNKTIVANTQYWEAKKQEYQTGLTPSNPNVNYDYLIGTPSNAGNQTDLTVTQSFDFPTVYIKKKQLSNEQMKQAEFQLNAVRQDVLLEAKLICTELIYRNKINSVLSNRQQSTEMWLTAFQKSLDQGQGNIMDVNKAKLQLIVIHAAYQENKSISTELSLKLTELNGGIPIPFKDTTYAPFSFMSSLDSFEKDIEFKDPIRKYLEQETVIGQTEVSLTKSLALPRIETGYHYQAILGQRFNGVHVGVTIPLWEHKNTVKTQQAELILNEANLQNHLIEHYSDIKQKYERMTNLKITLEEYQTVFSSLNNVELLDKSLSLGHISTIEYFMETSYYFEALKGYLQTELEYNKVVAELLKYQL